MALDESVWKNTDTAVLAPIKPLVLGHEGAGVVEQVGSSVKKVAQGDHVVLTYMWCGHCQPCLRGDVTYCANFSALNFGGAREDGSATT